MYIIVKLLCYGCFLSCLGACKHDIAKPFAILKIEKLADSSDFKPRDSMGEVVFDNKIWLLGGFTPDRSNEIWYSSDGKSWAQASMPIWSKRNMPGTIVFKNKIWIMGGFGGVNTKPLNDIYSSSDGINWVLEKDSAKWSPRGAFGLVEKHGVLYLFGGLGGKFETSFNDVWQSIDGKNWQLVTANAFWSKRGLLGYCVFKDKLWVIGGGEYDENYVYNVKSNYNDVWCSEDGARWVKVVDSADFSPRRFFRTFTHNEKMYIACGFELDKRLFPNMKEGLLKSTLSAAQLAFYDTQRGRIYGNLNDIWQSDNGSLWEKVSIKDTFPIRHEPSVVIKNNEIFLIGGFGVKLYNDVWKLK